MELKLNKKLEKKKGKLKEFIFASVLSASLIVGCGNTHTEENKIKNDNDTVHIEQDEKVEKEDKDTFENIDKEIEDEYNEKNDEEEILIDIIKEEFEKECYNPFTISEEIIKKCEEYSIFSKNGNECEMSTYECGVKKRYDELVQTIINNPTKKNWIKEDAYKLINLITKKYYMTFFGGENHKLIDLPEPNVSENDNFEEFKTDFELNGKKFYVVDKSNMNPTSTVTISDENGEEKKIIDNIMIFNGFEMYPIILERCSTLYYKQGHERDFAILNKIHFITKVREVLDSNNERSIHCNKITEEQIDEFIEKILE
jgi:hypothetical protein